MSTPDTATASRQHNRDWHALPAEAVVEELGSGASGLSSGEARARLERFGPNRLPESKRRGPVVRFLLQFHNLLIYVLLAAAVLSAAIGHVADSLVILAVVVINAIVGFLQEGRAENALDSIRAMIDPHSSVMRDGRRVTLPADEIVVGDMVLLNAGDRVPADLRLARARNLRIDEAALTGESVAADKGVGPVEADAALGDRTSMAFSGTFVAAGTGAGIAVATGGESQLGRISTLVGSVERLTTPLLRQINRLARQLTVIILAGAAAVFAFALLARDYHWSDAYMIVIGIVVSAIPEGLPAVMTVTLAIGMQRMAARRAIIRKLPAVETLGSVSVICSDKTGTLTRNEMTVRAAVTASRVFEVSGVGYRPEGGFQRDGMEVDPTSDPVLSETARAALLCNDADLTMSGDTWIVDGDPMEGALVSFAIKAGWDSDVLRKELPRDDEIPFDAVHRYMATLHHSHEHGGVAYIKGAPERLLSMCDRQRGAAGDEPIDVTYWRESIDALARQGQRVLAFAARPMPGEKNALTFADVEGGAVLLGVVGLIDPPRDEAIAAVRDCRSAGIRVKMITGDHATTASVIARQLELADDPKTITGQELDALDDEAFRKAAHEVTVFARTSPEHKLRLVEALQVSGEVTAMTGDGVNDAPALKRADIGVAMGEKGTEAAKEAAEVVLADDNFATIVAAVREGRTVYDNLRKVIAWTLPTNGGEFFAIITALALGGTLPITPIQILWINMVTAVALGLTFAFEPTEPGTMRRPPRPTTEPLLSRAILWRVLFVSLLFVAGVYGMFHWALERGLALETARTIVVNTIIVMEIFYLFSVRYVHGSSLTWQGVLGTPAVLIGIAVVVVAQLAFTYLPPMQALFDTRPVAFLDGVAVFAVGVALLLTVEAERLVRHLLLSGRGRAARRPD